MLRKLPAWGRLAPEPGPPAFLSPGAVCWARAYSGEGWGGQPACRARRRETVKAVPSPAHVPGPFLSEGQQEVRRKGRGGRRERVGGMGFIKLPAGCPEGSSWCE